jgi:hypothetical protein
MECRGDAKTNWRQKKNTISVIDGMDDSDEAGSINLFPN